MQPIKLYTIYTEAINLEATRAILGKYFDSFTIIPAQGIWKGGEEQALVIHIITFDAVGVYLAANEIKVRNKQDAVFVTDQSIGYKIL